jgi:hypothetical protein
VPHHNLLAAEAVQFATLNWIVFVAQEIICFPFVAYALMAFLSILPSFITKFIWRFVGPKDPALSEKQH